MYQRKWLRVIIFLEVLRETGTFPAGSQRSEHSIRLTCKPSYFKHSSGDKNLSISIC